MKVTPPILSTERPRASTKIARNSSVVTSGASTVWVATLAKRRTSFRYSVFSPSQLTRPIWRTWGGGWMGVAVMGCGGMSGNGICGAPQV